MDLTAADVQQKTFKERFRGYDPDEVEDFLDRVVETLRSHELKMRQTEEQLDQLQRELDNTREAEDAIKRTFITAQRTSQELVGEAEDKAARLIQQSRDESERTVAEAQREAEKLREDAIAEHDQLHRRVLQLRTAVSDMQSSLTAFAHKASAELEGIGATIDLETHSISEILSTASDASDLSVVLGQGGEEEEEPELEQTDELSEEPPVDEAVSETPAAGPAGREAAYLQQPRGPRPWERAEDS